MSTWKLLTHEVAKQIWDENLERFDDCSPFQSYAFGKFHSHLGWEPCYWAAANDRGDITALCLGLLRRYPLGVGIVWCAGGPVGNVENWDESLRNTILRTSGLKHLYVRFRCDRERRVSDALFLDHRGWSRSITPMTSSFSMELDLALDEDELSRRLDAKWRRNLRLASQNELKIELCDSPNIDELLKVLAEMEGRKQLPNLFSREKLENLFEHAASNLIFYRCEDRSGDLICFRGALTAGSRASDYIAATTEKGRELRASYAVLWQVIRECRDRGVLNYDLGGIDPWRNPGVYRFKRDTRAREVESLGEWDWATSSVLRFFGNWAIGRRQSTRSDRTNAASQITSQAISPLVLPGSQARQTSR